MNKTDISSSAKKDPPAGNLKNPDVKNNSTKTGSEKSGTFGLVLLFILLSAGIMAGFAFYFRHYERSYRSRVKEQLSSIAELKATEIVEWRKERMVDASIFFRNIVFSALVKHYFKDPGSDESRRQMQVWLGKLAAISHYDRLFLLDTAGTVRFALPGGPSQDAGHLVHDIGRVFRSGRITFLDFHRDTPDGKIHLALLVPLYDDNDRPLSVLVLRIDPGVYLYPYIKKWPIPSRSSETLICRREGDSVLFLNELKFYENAPLRLKIPVTQTRTPAVQAVLGFHGVMEGLDYRNVPVIASVLAVPGSPWFLVARTDTEEVYGPLKQQLRQMALFIGLILAGMGGCLFLLLRQQKMRQYREKARMADALKESERKLSEAHTLAQLGHWEWDLKSGKVVWSDEVYRIFRLDPARFTPQIDSILELSPWPEDHERDKELIRRAMKSREKGSYEQRFLRPDKSFGYYYSTFQGKYDRHGILVSIVGTVQDITGRKQLEDKLKQNNVHLEQKSRDLEQIIYVTSHDLRSPLVNVQGFSTELLRSIRGLTEAVNAGDISPEVLRKIGPILKQDIPESLGFIHSSITQMDIQLAALLKLSRLGRAVLSVETIDMNTAVADIVKSMEYSVKQKGARMELADLPPCLGDASHINQIFLNLIGNAVKYLDAKRPGVISISGGRQENFVVYCVEDNGIGIAEEYREKIFEIFYRVEQCEHSGEGLGLTIVRQSAERQNGAVWVESEPGKGSRFYVKLPSNVI